MYILIAILLLGILVTVHEAGHFWAARLTGIEVREFSVGFGPKLLGRTTKRGTLVSLRAIPMGGYCAFYGEDDADGSRQDDPRAFAKQKVWKRLITVLMGPGMNFLLAFVVGVMFFWLGGITNVTGYEPYISEVAGAGPAWEAGLKKDDIIREINGQNMLDGTRDTLLETIRAYKDGDGPLKLTVDRGGETFETELTPFWDEEAEQYRIGIIVGVRALTEQQAVSLPGAVKASYDWCVYAGGTILHSLKQLVTTGEGLDQTSGPVGIIQLVSEQVQAFGFSAFLDLLIVISINLGIMNLLPIPGLDGSRLLFMLLEVIRGKAIPPEKEARVHLAGYVLLLGLILVITYRDIVRLFQ